MDKLDDNSIDVDGMDFTGKIPPPQSPKVPAAEGIREQARKIIRAYYNATFEYVMEQIRKGDLSVVIANAEVKQRELDAPYLDKLEALLTSEKLALLDRLHRSEGPGLPKRDYDNVTDGLIDGLIDAEIAKLRKELED